jgi:BlaI family transcriptional regulator, penicillinase repressor
MKARRGRVAKVRTPLSGLDELVMRAVWDHEPCSVEVVYTDVARTRDLKEATVRTILRRLEQKGYLTHTVEGRAYIYRAVAPSRTLAARAVRAIVDTFCRGSVAELVTGLVEGEVLDDNELRALETAVREHRRRESAAKGPRR